jgi:RimJ/RimL family protein N-acetyltransferase
VKDVQIRPIFSGARSALLEMYRFFQPLGAAQGLPPFSEDSRQAWIDRLLKEAVHWGAFEPGGRLIGHALLAEAGESEAEIAFFVHQDYRQRRLGTCLVSAALDAAAELGYRRIWASVYADNVPALRLLHGRGFRRSRVTLPAIELELYVQQRPALKAAS